MRCIWGLEYPYHALVQPFPLHGRANHPGSTKPVSRKAHLLFMYVLKLIYMFIV